MALPQTFPESGNCFCSNTIQFGVAIEEQLCQLIAKWLPTAMELATVML